MMRSHCFKWVFEIKGCVFVEFIIDFCFRKMRSEAETPTHRQVDTPTSNTPIAFFDAWKMESSLPTMVLGKVVDIVEEYDKMKPLLTTKQKQLKRLFQYNQKLVRTVEEFIVHQKKIVDKYNALAKLYLDSFQKYCASKNWDTNFNVKPIRCVCQKINIGEWEFKAQEDTFPPPPEPFEKKILNIISKHYLNEHHQLQRQLDRVIQHNAWSHNSQQMLQAEQIRLSIKELNHSTPTLQNMFDLLDKKKNIEYDIRQLDIKSNLTHETFLHEDLNFVDEISAIHREMLHVSPQKLKEYLKNEIMIRKKLMKKHKKMKDQMEAYFEKIDLQNNELMEDIKMERKKREEIEKDRNNLKSMNEYLQLKGGVTNRKERSNNTMEILEEQTLRNTDMGMRETSKKQDAKIIEIQSEIKKLKKQVQVKSEEISSINTNKQSLEKELQNIRQKITLKLEEWGMQIDKQANTLNLLDKFLGFQTQSFRIDDREHLSKSQIADPSVGPIQIVISESVPNEEMFENRKIPQIIEKNKHMDDSSLIHEEGQSNSTDRMKSYNEKKDSELGEVSIAKEEMKEEVIQQSPSKWNKKINSSPVLINSQLMAIPQKNAVDEESKQIQTSRMGVDHSKHHKDQQSICNDDKESEKHSLFLKSQLSNSRETILKLKEQNYILAEEVKKLKEDIKILDAKLLQKSKAQPKSFISSVDGDIKTTDIFHAQQIETLCQSIAKQLCKLQGNQLQQVMLNVEDAIKTCRLGETRKKGEQNMNEPPMLSKNLQQDNLSKSDNVLGNLLSRVVREEEQKEKIKLKSSYTTEKERSMKLTLQSGEVKYLIKQEKSYYFKNKQLISSNIHKIEPQTVELPTPKKEKEEQPAIQGLEEEESDLRMKQQDLLEGVDTFNFEGVNWRKEKDHSLKFSKSNIKNSFEYNRDLELKSSLRIGNKYLDASYLSRLEHKLEDIMNDNENAKDLYWFYRKYQQAMEALERSQALIRAHQMDKENCMTKLTAEGTLSRHKLEETIYFLQQRVNELQSQTVNDKEEYEAAMTCQLSEMQELKVKALEVLGRNFLQIAQTS